MTVLPHPRTAAPMREPAVGVAESLRLWQELRVRHRSVRRLAETTLAMCPTAEVTILRAIATAYAEYLMAWRDASLDLTAPTPPAGLTAQRIQSLVARGTSVERSAGRSNVDPPTSTAPTAPVASLASQLEQEAAVLVVEVRGLLRRLDPDQPASRQARLGLVAAWGRYDDQLIALRGRGTEDGRAPELDTVNALRDDLARRVAAAQSLC